jgi:hypothetical protein
MLLEKYSAPSVEGKALSKTRLKHGFSTPKRHFAKGLREMIERAFSPPAFFGTHYLSRRLGT